MSPSTNTVTIGATGFNTSKMPHYIRHNKLECWSRRKATICTWWTTRTNHTITSWFHWCTFMWGSGNQWSVISPLVHNLKSELSFSCSQRIIKKLISNKWSSVAALNRIMGYWLAMCRFLNEQFRVGQSHLLCYFKKSQENIKSSLWIWTQGNFEVMSRPNSYHSYN